MAKYIEADILEVVTLMKSLKPGSTLSYARLTRATGKEMTSPSGKYIVKTARKRLYEDNGVVFNVVRGSGIRRMNDADIVKSGVDGLIRANRASEKSMRILKCVSDFDKLSAHNKVVHNAAMSIHGVVNRISTLTALTAIEGKISLSGGAVLAADDAMKFFLEL